MMFEVLNYDILYCCNHMLVSFNKLHEDCRGFSMNGVATALTIRERPNDGQSFARVTDFMLPELLKFTTSDVKSFILNP